MERKKRSNILVLNENQKKLLYQIFKMTGINTMLIIYGKGIGNMTLRELATIMEACKKLS
ncbi:MAG: hypothetical protein KAQ64_04725 [Candidatus Pacebacteria bacterium]|nr:hypothetical protein [Candidatus Paceibacterota bacterium]